MVWLTMPVTSINGFAMITLHHLNNSRSQRILWLLEELGVPYEIKRYQRDAKTMLAPPELRAIHPLGKSPVITDGDLTIAESGAIIEYLNDRYGHGRLIPAAGTPACLRPGTCGTPRTCCCSGRFQPKTAQSACAKSAPGCRQI